METTYEEFTRKDNQTLTLLGQFSVVLLWPAFLVAAPLAVNRLGGWCLPLVALVGTYLVMWVGLLRHEVWHKNFSRLDSRRTFRLLSYLIFLDPHPYLLGHGPHHTFVHTVRDPVLFCEDHETSPRARRRAFLLEFFLGNAAWELAMLKRLVKAGKVSRREVLAGLPLRALPLALTAALTYALGGAEALGAYGWTTLAVVWTASQAARHVQWVEHLGVLAEGTMEERSMVTRNLTNETFFGWLFNLLTHQEAWNHTYHHVEPGRPLSSIDHVRPAADHVTLNGSQYARLLWSHWKSL